MKAGDRVIVIEADTHTSHTRSLIGRVFEVKYTHPDGITCDGDGRVTKLYYNEIRPFKEYQVLQILRQWKRSLK